MIPIGVRQTVEEATSFIEEYIEGELKFVEKLNPVLVPFIKVVKTPCDNKIAVDGVLLGTYIARWDITGNRTIVMAETNMPFEPPISNN
jgi:hypothetical protein